MGTLAQTVVISFGLGEKAMEEFFGSCFGKILWALSLVDSTSAHRQIVVSMNGPACELTFLRIGLSVKRLSVNHPGSEQ